MKTGKGRIVVSIIDGGLIVFGFDDDIDNWYALSQIITRFNFE